MMKLAKDESDRIAIAGGFLKGKQVGIGTSIGVNVVDQHVDAFIGRAPNASGDIPISGSTAPPASTISVPVGVTTVEDVTVTATTEGDIFALVMAGAAQGSLPERPAAKDKSTTQTSRSSTPSSPPKPSVAILMPVSTVVVRRGHMPSLAES